MAMSSEIKKQITVALYSSLAVSVLTTTPVFMMTRISFSFYPWTLLFTTMATVVMWWLNILFFYVSKGNRVVRYGCSYAVCLLFAVGVIHGFMYPQMEGAFDVRGRGFYFHIILFFSVDTVLLIVQDLVVIRERKAAVEL